MTTQEILPPKYPSLAKEYKKEHSKKYRELHRDEILDKKRIYREAHREELAAKSREYNRLHKDQVSIRQKERRSKQKEIIVERSRKYYKKNNERIKERVKKYSKTSKGKFLSRKSWHNRRIKNKDVENTLTLKQWNKILNMQDNRCNICKRKFGSRLSATQDHIIPLSKGGGLTFENVQALCKKCNSSKQAKLDKSLIVTWITPKGVVS